MLELGKELRELITSTEINIFLKKKNSVLCSTPP